MSSPVVAPRSVAATPARGSARPLLFLAMAVCSGATVANVYLAQPLLALLAGGFGASRSAAGVVVTCAQFGYAAGILLLVPLGDVRRRRPLLGALLAVTVAMLLAAAAAPGLAVLAAATALIGGATVIPQVLVPLAAELAPPERRASVVANVQIGLLTGIVGSRVVGGAVGQLLGWRAVYLLAAALTAVAGAVTVRLLPAEGERTGPRYTSLLASLPRLLREQPALRHSSLLHGALFGAYSATWTTLVLVLTGRHYHFSSAVAGLFGLLGLAGAVAAPWAGRFIDRRGPLPIAAAALLLTLLSAGAYALGSSRLVAVILGIVLANVGVQWSQLANQARVLAHLPDVRSRANTVFMVIVFLCGAVAAAASTACYGAFGWGGVCAVQAALALAGLLVLPAAYRYDSNNHH
ncbi:MFS transporter [Kitasatospora viridis]|uniref:Putative MFS family arabinose efflux permease n=1 Tax=Kitasatospora viridis TaxID=281105 RepID=A0A561UBI7_9ACTN|nr:MFS transporter [Kitasatospora viridis]TWF96720.1 putative MFS family arabinose efflux permease [Kitasatospora viridis]